MGIAQDVTKDQDHHVLPTFSKRSARVLYAGASAILAAVAKPALWFGHRELQTFLLAMTRRRVPRVLPLLVLDFLDVRASGALAGSSGSRGISYTWFKEINLV